METEKMSDNEFSTLAIEKGLIVKSLKDIVERINGINDYWFWMVKEETPTKLVIEIRRVKK